MNLSALFFFSTPLSLLEYSHAKKKKIKQKRQFRPPFLCFSLYTTPTTLMFDPSNMSKKEDFDRLEAKTEVVIEKTAKNQKNIHNTLTLILTRLTNYNP